MLDPTALLKRLNTPQRSAVTHGEGPVLILAGAGSGKTRVITHRIAWLIGSADVSPREIVAVTFTNKAAAEMRGRVEQRLGHDISGAFIGTFHSYGLRLLRANALAAGYPPSFVIYDTTDQRALVRAVLKELEIDEKAFPPRQVLSWISKRKNELLDPDEAESKARYPHEKIQAACYRAYEERLARCAAVDFDDLLVKPVRLFRAHPEIALRYARRTRWLLVDEYQDTNPIQYALIRHLSAEHGNVCCVGDEDQSIYGFRGADVRNILDFSRDYPQATVIKLEQNYRSTSRIIDSAAAVIANNVDRHEKTLWTENPEGERIVCHTARDDREEADFVVDGMLSLARRTTIPLEEMAILYRTNATSRLFEDRLASRNIPYRIVGSLRFYDRKEIKDLIAWLRLIAHPGSDQDFLRAACTPPRGIGAKTLQDLALRAEALGSSLFEATEDVIAHPEGFTSRAVKALGAFRNIIRDLAELSRGISTTAVVTSIMEAIGYAAYLEKAYPNDFVSRVEHLDALTSAAEEHDEAGAPDDVAGFLDRISLRSDSDDVQGAKGPSLMTVHAAKGLEFDAVYIAGVNEDLFPHARAAQEPDGMEEERRLMYVAMTRARKQLTLSSAHFRRQYGEPILCHPSCFLAEIPQEHVELSDNKPRAGLPDAPVGGAFRGWSPGRQTSKSGRKASPASRTPAAGTSRPRGELHIEADPEAIASGEMPFRKGMQITHPAFGPGVILGVSGAGDRLTLDIRFERAGRKRILPKYTTLL